MSNPKLVGSNIIDAIPQTGECPNRCSECFYNGGRFYRTLDEPLLPTMVEALGKIVRVNSGNDSNNKRTIVLDHTEQYVDKFYNTAIPKFEFPGPVVLTVNPQHNTKPCLIHDPPPNLMFVRVRAGIWDTDVVEQVWNWYKNYNVPVVVTFMRYYNSDLIPKEHKGSYTWKQHITNAYHVLKPEDMVLFMEHFKGKGVLMCGTPYSSFCVDCGNCEALYWRCKRRWSALAGGPVG